MITVVVAGRNDDYGGRFAERFFRAWNANLARLLDAGLSFELLFVEWNPLPDRPLLSEQILAEFALARTIVVPPEVHARYSPNPHMPFHEMPAKNIGIRHAHGDWVLVANADVVLGRDLVAWLQRGQRDRRTLYRAHRIDVPGSLSIDRVEEPGHQLPSGEGLTKPCDYLGAGGDFGFASKALWLELGGFDETVRFTTRGKDWQFFLSAREQQVDIEFAGRIYHLDHDGGFRNTSASERARPSVHFGTWWDLEAAVPIQNDGDWGLASARFEPDAREPRLCRVPSHTHWARLQQEPHLEMSLLTRPAGQGDHLSRTLLHVFLRAAREDRRVVADFVDASALLALAGFAAVAGAFGVETYSRTGRPPVTWACAPVQFVPDLRLNSSDLVLTTRCGHVVATNRFGETTRTIEARCQPTAVPEFNPLLARRLLRAWLTLDAEGRRRIAVFGAGSHTEQLLRWGIPDGFSLDSIVVTRGQNSSAHGLPIKPISSLHPDDVDAVLLSSASYEPEMRETATKRGFRVVALYSDWPRSFWSVERGSRRPSSFREATTLDAEPVALAEI